MTLGEAILRFGFHIDKSSVSTVENTVNNIKSMATKALGAIGIVFTISGLAELAEAAANAEATASQFTQVFDDLEDQARNSLSKIAEDTGIVENRLKGSYTQIAAFAKTTGMETADALSLTNRAMTAVADSAAFYDRSLENVTESLQSFLKGNFENDAALGLSCTETTRNAAANALYGKSFKDLAEDQKQLTLLKMVEDANQASGALGQAARESDTWTNQLGNLKQALVDIKAAAGSTFLKPAVVILKLLTSLVQKAIKAIKGLTKENGLLTRVTERYHALVKRLQPAIERMIQSFSKGLKQGIEVVKQVVRRLGGIENALKILTIVAGAFLLAMNWNKILFGAGKLMNILSGIGKLFSLANLKLFAMIAVFALLALVVEDFFHFLMGNDSVLGTVFDSLGMNAEATRQAVGDAFERLKEFLVDVWEFLKESAELIFQAIQEFFLKHGEQIQADFERVWGLIQTLLDGVWTFLSQLAETIFGDIFSTVDGSSMSTKEKLLSIWQTIVDKLSAVLDALYDAFHAVLHAIAAVIETVFGWIQAFWDRWGERILSWFKVLWDSLGGILNGFLDIIKGVANFISSVFTGDWQGAWETIKQIFTGIWDIIVNFITTVWDTIKMLFEMALGVIKAIWETIWGAISSFFQGIWNGIVSFVTGIWDTITTGISNFLNGISEMVDQIKETIVNGLTVAIDWIKGLPAQALQWGSDIIGGIVDGIQGAIGKITDAVSGVANKIKSFLHFSTPDEGPLTDYERWMPDFMNGLATSMKQSSGGIQEAIQGISEQIAEGFQQALATTKALTETELSQLVAQLNDFLNQCGTLLSAILPQAASWGKQMVLGLEQGMEEEFHALLEMIQALMQRMGQSILPWMQTFQGSFRKENAWMPDLFGGLTEQIGQTSSIINTEVVALAQAIQAVVREAFLGATESSKADLNTLQAVLLAGLQEIASMMEVLPPQAYQWGADFIHGFQNGILSGMDAITTAVSGIAAKIRSFLHFSVPDEGPLTDYEHWMPDFMKGLAKGIGDQEGIVLEQVRTLTDHIALLTQAATAQVATVANSTIHHTTSSLTQNVNINNSYSGGSLETQKNVSKAMKKSAVDATTYMARGLAYARG